MKTEIEELITELRAWHVLAGSLHIANAERRAALGVMLERQQQLIDRTITLLAQPLKVYCVNELEPESDYPCVVVGTYDNEQAANDHVAGERDAHGLADDDEYEESEISWEVEAHEVRSTAQVLIVDRRSGEN